MGVRIRVGDYDYEAIDYSVDEDATPLAANDSSGSVGTINFTIPRPDEDSVYAFTPNAFTNPGFAVNDGTRILQTNLIPNPSFEATSGTVEVRRNLYTNPVPASATSWGAVNGATSAYVTSPYQAVKVTTPIGGITDSGVTLASRTAWAPGEVWTISLDVESSTNQMYRVNATGSGISYTADNRDQTSGSRPAWNLVAGVKRRIWLTLSVSESSTGGVFFLRTDTAVSQEFLVSHGLLEKLPVAGAYFDGYSSPDPDLTPSWTGTANASQSVLSGQRVVGNPGGYQSQQWAASGGHSLFLPELSEVVPGLAGTQVGAGSAVIGGFTALSDRILYSVFDVVNTAGSYNQLARLGTNSGGGQIVLQTQATGVTSLGARFDLAGGSTNASSNQAGARTVGRHIAWAQVLSGMTQGQYAVDKETVHGTLTLTPGTGMEANPTLSASTWASNTTVFTVAYRGSHTEAQRLSVLGWLKARYQHVLLDDQTFIITPRNDGQIVYFNGVEHVTEAGVPVRIQGSGYIGLSPGWWDDQLLVAGNYAGPYFDGDSEPNEDGTFYDWRSTPNASVTDLLAYIPEDVTPDTDAYRLTGWPHSGSHFLRVLDNAEIDIPETSTVSIIARSPGQTATLGASTATSINAGEVLEVQGTGTLVLDAGDWGDPLIHVEGTTVYNEHPINKYTQGWLIGQSVSLIDTRYGFTLGEVTSADYNHTQGTIGISCISRLGDLNDYNIQAEPFVGTLGGAFQYYCDLGGATVDISIDPAVESRPVALPGWNGELWYYLKQLALAQDCEISLVSGIILLRPIRGRAAEKGYTTQRAATAGGGQLAQAVEVYWYRTQEITDQLVYPAGGWTPEVEVLNVNAGETTEYTLDLSSSLESIEAPTMKTFVPQETGSYRITAVGAQGGGPSGGLGAEMSGVFDLQEGQVLKILVGQMGNPDTTPTGNRGGGGGSFVWDDATGNLLIAAGGGGGSHTTGTGNALGMNASIGTSGTPRRDGTGTPGASGNGALGGAAGWFTDGGAANVGAVALRPLAGGTGAEGYPAGTATHFGGFGGGGGGGGSPSTTHGSGGGGGYSGGAGQGTPASIGGGGGGSYNGGSNQSNLAGVGEGNGRVTITFINDSTVFPATSTGRTGTVQEFTAPQDSNLASVYTVVADDGLPVNPDQWEAFGGKVEVILNPDTVSLTVKLTGAESIPLATGGTSRSFSLALASDESGSRYSTLRIIGTGVSYHRDKKRIRTGVPASRTSTEVGVTIDNPFINDLNSLYRAGTRAAKMFTGESPGLQGSVTAINRRGDSGAPLMTYGQVQDQLVAEIGGTPTYGNVQTYYVSTLALPTYGDVQNYWASFEEETFESQAFGNVSGARVWDPFSKRWYRIRNGTITAGGVNFSQADDDLTFEDVDGYYAGFTYGDLQTLRSGLTYAQERLVGLRE